MVPMRARQMRLRLAPAEDADYLAGLLMRIGPAGTSIQVGSDRSMWLPA
jgi:hypothetical protein